MRLLKPSSGWTRLGLLALVAILTIFIVACGGDATPTPAATAAPTTAATRAPAPTAAATQAPQPTAMAPTPRATTAPTPRATAAPAPTAAPTAAPRPTTSPRPTAVATAAPRPTVAPTTAATEPVASRLLVAIPNPSYQYTMQHPMNQIAARIMPIYDHLVGHDPKTNEELPQLAESWIMGPDGKTYSWVLRQNVPFYKDAQPTNIMFSAKDAVHSFGIFAGVNSERTLGIRPEFGGMVDADIVNDHLVTLRLAQVNLAMPFLLSDEWATGITSKDWWDLQGEDGYFADPIGNGHWSLVELKVDQHVLHERVEDHWRITPGFPEAQFLFAPEQATRLAMLLTGEAHISAIPQDLHVQAEERGMVISKSTLPAVHTHIRYSFFKPDNYVNPETGEPALGQVALGPTEGYDPNDPLRNVKVRQALNYAINYNEINDTFFRGEGFPLV